MAQRRGVPSPAPANYDYQGPAAPGPITNRPVSGFETNMVDWMRSGRTPPGRTGAFRPEDFAPYTPEGNGTGYGASGQHECHRVQGGLPVMARGEEIPYADFRDVTGNVLTGPARRAPYGGGMDFGVTREGASAGGGIPYGRIAAGAAGIGLPLMMAYDSYRHGPMGAKPVPQGARWRHRVVLCSFLRLIFMASAFRWPGMEATEITPRPAKAAKAPKAGKKAVPTPPERPSKMSPQQAAEFEGNLNYYVTQMLDQLTGRREAERGQENQEYYATHPWPY